jgi:hypothetical protein
VEFQSKAGKRMKAAGEISGQLLGGCFVCSRMQIKEQAMLLKHVSNHATNMLMTYLLNHEADIANGANDFGDLSLMFYELINRSPRAMKIHPKQSKAPR